MSNQQQQPPAQTQALAKKTPQDIIKGNAMAPSFLKSMTDVLPKHMSAERQSRVLLMAMAKQPKLMDCTWQSIFLCMIDCSQMGLEPDGRRAHLIPYGKACTLIIDYKGLIELIMRTGLVEFLDAFPVYEKELDYDEKLQCPRFEIEYGANPRIIHKPIIVGDRGPFVGAYAVAHVKGTTKPKFVWMTKEEIDGIKARSRAGNSGPWVTDYIEMAKKTTIRRIAKTLPLTSEIAEHIQKETEHEFGQPDDRFNALQPARARVLPPGESSELMKMVGNVDVQAETQAAAKEKADRKATSQPAQTQQEPPQEQQPEPPPEQEAEVVDPEPEQPQEQQTQQAPPQQQQPPPQQQAPPQKASKPTAPPSTVGIKAATEEDILALEQACAREEIDEAQLCGWASEKFMISRVDTVREVASFAPKRIKFILQAFMPNPKPEFDFIPEIKAWKPKS